MNITKTVPTPIYFRVSNPGITGGKRHLIILAWSYPDEKWQASTLHGTDMQYVVIDDDYNQALKAVMAWLEQEKP